MAQNQIKILHVEDSEDDSLLVQLALKKQGIEPDICRVDTTEDLNEKLALQPWDVILCDYNVPGMHFDETVKKILAIESNAPVITLSGAIGEMATVDIMKLGVDDLLLKNDITRLGDVIDRNIKSRKLAREANEAKAQLTESLERYALLWENSSTGYFLMSKGVIVDCNETLCKLWNQSKNEIISQTADSLTGNATLKAKGKSFTDYEKELEGETDNQKIRFRYQYFIEGQTAHYDVTISKIAISGQTVCLVAIRDASEDVQRQERLLLQDRALQYANNGIVITRREEQDDPIIWANAAFLRMTGYSMEEVIGKDCRFLTHGIQPQPQLDTMKTAVRQGENTSVVVRNKRKNGYEFWNHFHLDPVYDEEGNLTHYIGVLRDVSREIEAEKKLKRSESLLRETGDIAKVGGWELNISSKELYWSDITYKIHGLTTDYKPNLDDAIKFYHPEDRTRVSQIVAESIRDCKDFYFEARLITHQKNTIWVRTSGRPVVENNEYKLFRGYVQDITPDKENKQKEKALNAQVLQLQRLETIGTLASGIAHDFNNILGAIRGWSELAERHCGDNANVLDDIKHIQIATERARDLVKQILTFSREIEEERMPTEPAAILEETVKMLRSTLPSSVNLNTKIDQSTAKISANAGEIQQVIMNLGINALHALPDAMGDITIGLRQTTKNLHPKSGLDIMTPVAEITVSDTGCGIPAEIQSRIFEPFFTTKALGEGTGLGLSVVHGIIVNHGGKINVQSSPDLGTIFTIDIPLCKPDSAAEEISSRMPEQRGTEHIILVDDEPEITDSLARNLKGLGYQLTIFSDSAEALDAFAKNPSSFDLIISDQIMPKLTGSELITEMRKIKPNLPAIIMTGFSHNISDTVKDAEPITRIIFKPSVTADITQAIRELCDPTA